MPRASAVLLAFALASIAPSHAHACKCAPQPSIAAALQHAAAVFEGRVSKLTPLGSNDLVVELSVVRTWKDANSEHILLRTHQDEAACGFSFAPNESYLIYADEAPNDASLPGLEVMRCGRTKLITQADADLAELGIGSVPVSPRRDDAPTTDSARPPSAIATAQSKPAAGGCASCSAIGRPARASSALGLVLFGLVRICRRQRRRRLKT
ncbi:MAG TPA: hypothetical protein VGI70_09935 [Polyangiales bacterium]